MQLIPITSDYRRGYDNIRWDVDDMGVVRAVPAKPVPASIVDRIIKRGVKGLCGSWEHESERDYRDAFDKSRIPGMPVSRYQGC